MDNTTLKNIFKFLEDEGEHRIPFMWKASNNIPLTEEDLNVNGNLDLRRSNITSLPEGLKVWGNLILEYSKITSLPEELKVGGSLDLSFSKIASLPEELKVGGSLHLDFTKITSLPEGLYVDRNLYLIMCKNLKSLSKGLKVGGDLNIRAAELMRYSNEKLMKMIDPNGDGEGYIKGRIIR